MTPTLSRDRKAAVGDFYYLPMSTCPTGVKVVLYGDGVATVATFDGKTSFWQGWYPLPKFRRPQ